MKSTLPTATTPDRLDALEHLGGRLTELVAAVHGLVVNDCLSTETLTFPASGVVTRSWSVPFGSVAVTSLSTLTVTVVAGEDTNGTAPTSGAGVALVAAGKGATYVLSGRALTLYGKAGDSVTVSVFTRPQPPAWG